MKVSQSTSWPTTGSKPAFASLSDWAASAATPIFSGDFTLRTSSEGFARLELLERNPELVRNVETLVTVPAPLSAQLEAAQSADSARATRPLASTADREEEK